MIVIYYYLCTNVFFKSNQKNGGILLSTRNSQMLVYAHSWLKLAHTTGSCGPEKTVGSLLYCTYHTRNAQSQRHTVDEMRLQANSIYGMAWTGFAAKRQFTHERFLTPEYE
jgi:hypothetical protein